ncbi:hypothetical protein FOZ62_003875, partial [Perkinsus olseni]
MSSLAQRISSTVAKRVVASPEPTPLAIYCYKKHFMRQQQIKEKIKGLQNPQKADCGPLGEYKCDSLNVPSAPITGGGDGSEIGESASRSESSIYEQLNSKSIFWAFAVLSNSLLSSSMVMSSPATRKLCLTIPNRVAATASGTVRNLSTSAPRFYTQEEINTAQNFFQLMMDGDITGAAKLAEPQAKTLGMGVEEFMAKQASERAYLIYRFSSSERQEAIRLAMDGEGFDQGLTEEERQANTS